MEAHGTTTNSGSSSAALRVSVGPPQRKRTRREKLAKEWALLRRDGPVKYLRVMRALRRFHRSLRHLAVTPLPLAADNVEGGITVSIGGLVLGAIIGLCIYLLADYLAGREGQPAIKLVGVILALVVFVLLGFDFQTE